MELIAYLLIGAATGLLCRVIIPHPVRMGLVRMLIIGMVGGGAGGMIVGTFHMGKEPFVVGVPTIVGAIIGALIAVFVLVGLNRKRVHA